MALRPRVRIPLWAAVAVVAAAYVTRSAIRGWDFRLDLPVDAIIGAALIALIALRVLVAKWVARHDGEE